MVLSSLPVHELKEAFVAALEEGPVVVTSPAGTSAAAIAEMERGRLRTVLSEAVFAAYRRTEELGRELEEQTASED